MGPCAKQVVTAVLVTPDEQMFYGENDCANPQVSCPRVGMATGEGYAMCSTICKQHAHAEINAINTARRANAKLPGSKLYLRGHTYACETCKTAMKNAGVELILVTI